MSSWGCHLPLPSARGDPARAVWDDLLERSHITGCGDWDVGVLGAIVQLTMVETQPWLVDM